MSERIGKPWKLGGRTHRIWFWKAEHPDPDKWVRIAKLAERDGKATKLSRFIDEAFWGEWPWRLYCRFHGHQPIDDQCGIPSHRYCWVCQTGTPNAEVTP